MEVIAYNQDGLRVIHPNQNFDAKMIADKDVPMGILYKLINTSDLPSREYRNLWEIEINESNKDGIGLSKEEFETKYPEFKDMSVN